jgi:hypothetical protein
MYLHRRIFFFRFSTCFCTLFSSFVPSRPKPVLSFRVCVCFSLYFFLTLVLLFYVCVFIWPSIKENSFTLMSVAFYIHAHALHFFVLQFFFSLIFLDFSSSSLSFFCCLFLSLQHIHIITTTKKSLQQK